MVDDGALDSLRESVNGGKPYGSEQWVAQTAADWAWSSRFAGREGRQNAKLTEISDVPFPFSYPAEDEQKPNEWTGGCEDPRCVEAPDGTYVLTYTQWNHAATHLAIATSKDLVHWKKYGPAFGKALHGKYAAHCKSASIVCKVTGGRLIAAKINGKYQMYWGEGDIYGATSDDLIDWTPIESSPGHLQVIMPGRGGCFDSGLAEGGPPSVLTERGIIVLYNGKNNGSDKELDKGAYAVGQALFDAHDAAHLLARPQKPFFQPTEAFERSGQYAAGTTFAEGLVYFHSKWFLYYGCADSFVGVAVFDPSKVSAPPAR